MWKSAQAAAVAAMLAIGMAAPSLAVEFASRDDAQYQACVALTQKAPEDALESALAWRDLGGGAPAKHCVALALVAMRQYPDAADRLEQLAAEMKTASPGLRAQVLDQAGNAWLLANQPDMAKRAFSAGLDLRPEDIDLLIDRARASAGGKDFAAAVKDLDLALSLDPTRADALAFRGSARRQLGNSAGALEDVETALAIDGNQVDALLERGLLRRAAGDKKGARQDWLKVALLAPGTPAADAAQADLEAMDLKTE